MPKVIFGVQTLLRLVAESGPSTGRNPSKVRQQNACPTAAGAGNVCGNAPSVVTVVVRVSAAKHATRKLSN